MFKMREISASLLKQTYLKIKQPQRFTELHFVVSDAPSTI